MNNVFNRRFSRLIRISAFCLPVCILAQQAVAEDFTADVLMRDYDDGQRSLFLTGVIEGLAQARYEHDGKDPAGAKCVYNWFYGGGKDSLLQIYSAFGSHSNSAPAAIVSALVNRECGT